MKPDMRLLLKKRREWSERDRVWFGGTWVGPAKIWMCVEIEIMFTTVSRMFWYETLALNWICTLIHFSYHLNVKKCKETYLSSGYHNTLRVSLELESWSFLLSVLFTCKRNLKPDILCPKVPMYLKNYHYYWLFTSYCSVGNCTQVGNSRPLPSVSFLWVVST